MGTEVGQNDRRKEKLASESTDFLADIVGEESLTGAGRHMSASAILDLMDLLAGRIAVVYAENPCTTVSFDRVDIIVPILHGDLVRCEGQVVNAGSSSITIHVTAKRHDVVTRTFKTAAYSFITYVAIDQATLRPHKNIPNLRVVSEEEVRLQSEAKRRRALTLEWLAVQKAAASGGRTLKPADVQDGERDPMKRELLSISETEVVIRKQMLPRHNNHLNIIFGGDVLRWMLSAATLTATRFTGNRNMIVVSMNRIDFKQPIKPLHVLELHAKVVSARYYVVEVEIEAFVDKAFERLGTVSSHNGYFTVLNLDELGFRRPVTVGLLLTDDDQDGLQRCAKAKARRDFDKKLEAPTRTTTGFWME